MDTLFALIVFLGVCYIGYSAEADITETVVSCSHSGDTPGFIGTIDDWQTARVLLDPKATWSCSERELPRYEWRRIRDSLRRAIVRPTK